MIAKAAIPCLMMFSLLGLGCSRHLSNSNLKEVHDEMSTKEVESILGPPTRSDSHVEITRPETTPVTHYYYDQDGKTVELIFYGDKLMSGSDAIHGTFEN